MRKQFSHFRLSLYGLSKRYRLQLDFVKKGHKILTTLTFNIPGINIQAVLIGMPLPDWYCLVCSRLQILEPHAYILHII
jgi:hypothetical protein